MDTGQTRQPILGITGPQIFSGALASVTAAVVASYFGIAGTLIGAAITSVIATIGGAFYRHSLERARARIVIRRDPRTGATTKEIVTPTGARPKRRLPWVPIGAAIVIVFALALGAVTVVEIAAQRPIASLFGRAEPDSVQTSLGVAVREVSNPAPQAEPTAAPGLAPSPSAIATGIPGAAPSGTVTPAPTLIPTAPTSRPSSAPPAAPPSKPAGAPQGPTAAPDRPVRTPIAP